MNFSTTLAGVTGGGTNTGVAVPGVTFSGGIVTATGILIGSGIVTGSFGGTLIVIPHFLASPGGSEPSWPLPCPTEPLVQTSPDGPAGTEVLGGVDLFLPGGVLPGPGVVGLGASAPG